MTSTTPWAKRHAERLWVAAFFALLALGVLQLTEHTLFKRAEWLLYDQLIPESQQRSTIDPRIVIVDIDDASLARNGRWPWPRDTIAALLNNIQHADPALIAVDILFPEPDTPVLDLALQDALSAPNLVTAIALGSPNISKDSPWPFSEQLIDLSPSLAGEHIYRGHISPYLDEDGSIRRLAPIICHVSGCYPSLSTAAAQVLMQQPLSLVDPGDWQQTPRLCIGSTCQPLTDQGYQLIPYSARRFSYLHAADILDGTIDTEQLAGRIVLVGTSAAGLGDLVSTPINPLTPGVEIHARMIAAWLDQDSITAMPQDTRLNGILSTGLILLTLLVILTQQRRYRVILYTAVLTLSCIPYLLALISIWFNPIPLTITGLFALVTDLGCVLRRQRQQRWRMRKAFSAYVPDVVVDSLVQQGYSLEQLDAQRADVSIMFADIQGFTRMTEQMPPETLVELTQLLFTEITDEIQHHGGTLDKFIGDAVMAFWGAPLHDPQHSLKAVSCAIAIQQRLKTLQPHLKSMGYPAIQFKIGLESGNVIAGNLGAEQRRAYTVMGEAVNAAARIEEAAGHTQAGILLGPNISSHIKDSIPLQPVACFNLSGISRPMLLSAPQPNNE
jgi:adenylate cyclase